MCELARVPCNKVGQHARRAATSVFAVSCVRTYRQLADTDDVPIA